MYLKRYVEAFKSLINISLLKFLSLAVLKKNLDFVYIVVLTSNLAKSKCKSERQYMYMKMHIYV